MMIGLALLLLIAVLVLVVAFLLADLGAYFTKIEEGTTVFIDAGDSMADIWPNVGNYMISKERDPDGWQWLIQENDAAKRMESFFSKSNRVAKHIGELLWKKFGIRFISLFWPQIRVHKFDLRKGGRRRIESRSAIGNDAPLRARIVDSHGSGDNVVESLLFLVPRPVYLEGIELAGDNARINLLVLPVFRQVIPALPVYYLKGDFFSLLDAAIEAAIVDFCSQHLVKDETGTEKHLTYKSWLELPKAGEGSPIEEYLRTLNITEEYIESLESRGAGELADYAKKLPGAPSRAPMSGHAATMIPHGIVPRFGFALVSFRIVDWEPHESTKPLAEALLAKGIEHHKAEGVREKAFGARDALFAQAEGESKRYTQLIEALVDKGVDPDVAAQVMATQLRMENIRGAGLATYVEGGSSAIVTLPVPADTRTPAAQNQSTST